MKYYRTFVREKNNQEFTVEIEINIDELAKILAARAIVTKNKKSTAYMNSIKCKVID